MKAIYNDPSELLSLSKEELVKAYSLTCDVLDELDNQRKAIKDLLADKIKGNGEIVGEYAVTKVKRVNFKMKLDKAKELGATKESIDTRALKELFNRGVEIPHTTTEYLLIKEVQKK